MSESQKWLERAYNNAKAESQTFNSFFNEKAFADFHDEATCFNAETPLPEIDDDERVLERFYPIRRTEWYGERPLHKDLMIDISAVCVYHKLNPKKLNANYIFKGLVKDPINLLAGITEVINSSNVSTPYEANALYDLTLLRWYLWQLIKK
jgi:hypothetical protein